MSRRKTHKVATGRNVNDATRPLRSWKECAKEFNRRNPNEPPMDGHLAGATGANALNKIRKAFAGLTPDDVRHAPLQPAAQGGGA